MVKKKSNKRWLQRQNNDHYVKQAQASHYRSRAVYKLREIDQRDRLIEPNYCVVDLGAAPGSWSQYSSEKVGVNGRVVAVDLLPMAPIDRVLFVLGDFTDEIIEKTCIERLGQSAADLVISDMAPNLTGIRATDQARSMVLAELALHFCHQVLKPGGHLVVKLFEGSGITEYRQQLQQHFAKIMTRKPDASRHHSREFYMLARSYRL